MRPLNSVQAIGTAINLYRSNFLTYTRIALIAVGWSLLPSLSFFLLMKIASLLRMMGAPTPVIALSMTVLISLSIMVNLYSIAKTLMNNALISRLAFQELIQQPESVPKARRFLQPQMWNIFLAHFFTGLLIFGIILGVFAIKILSIFFGFGSLSNLVALGLLFWFLTRFFISEIPIAIEKNLSATDTINRSRKLSQGSGFHVLLIIVLGSLLTIPLLPLLVTIAPTSMLLSFWQLIKAVIYYNLRSYQEGVDLKLSHPTSAGLSPPILSPSSFSSSPSLTPPIATGNDVSQPQPDISASSPPSTPVPTQSQSSRDLQKNKIPAVQLISQISKEITGTLSSRKSRTSLKISAAAEPIAQQLQQMEVDFSHLEAKHWQAIENYLKRRTKLNRETRQQTGLRLAKGIKKVLAIKQLPQKMTADLFLEAVYCVHRSRS